MWQSKLRMVWHFDRPIFTLSSRKIFMNQIICNTLWSPYLDTICVFHGLFYFEYKSFLLTLEVTSSIRTFAHYCNILHMWQNYLVNAYVYAFRSKLKKKNNRGKMDCIWNYLQNELQESQPIYLQARNKTMQPEVRWIRS